MEEAQLVRRLYVYKGFLPPLCFLLLYQIYRAFSLVGVLHQVTLNIRNGLVNEVMPS